MINLLYVPEFLAKEDVLVKISDGLDENGSPKITSENLVKARIESSNSVAYTKDGQKVRLSLKAFIFKGHENFYVGMSGECIVEGKEYKVVTTKKLENPDGSVNHYVLGLM